PGALLRYVAGRLVLRSSSLILVRALSLSRSAPSDVPPSPSGVPPCSIRCRRRRMRGARAGRTRVCPSGWFGGKDPHAQAASYPAATRPVSGGRGDPGRRAPVGGLVLAADRDRRRVGAAPVGPAAGDGDRDPGADRRPA